jgi:hypothetical protein
MENFCKNLRALPGMLLKTKGPEMRIMGETRLASNVTENKQFK